MALAPRTTNGSTTFDGSTASANQNVTAPSGLQAGDVVVAIAYQGDTATLSATAPATGWTTISSVQFSGQQASAMFVRVAAAGEASSTYTFHSTSANGSWGVVVQAYTGGAGTWETPTPSGTATSGTTIAAAAYSSSVASGDYDVVGYTSWNSTTWGTDSTGFTSRATNGGSANNPTAIYDHAISSSGTQSATHTSVGSATGGATYHRVALIAAAGATDPFPAGYDVGAPRQMITLITM